MTGLARAEIADSFRGNSAAYENLILLAPHFGLSQRHHSAPYTLVPGTADHGPSLSPAVPVT
jgi:hypothetical protein